MTGQYSVMENPNLSHTPSPTVRPIETRNALALLTGRQLHVCGDNIYDAIATVRPGSSAVVIAGSRDRRQLQKLHAAYPNVPLIIEPGAVRQYVATPEAPFDYSEDADSLLPQSLTTTLDGQLVSGAHVTMTPTGQITSGPDGGAILRKILEEVNGLDRKDLIVALPLEGTWLDHDSRLKQLAKVISLIRHPVAIMFTSQDNPLSTAKRLGTYRKLFIDAPGKLVAYRTDLAGFDALAHGAIASAIGAYPSLRRLNPAGKKGRSGNRSAAPHLFIADIGRFVTSKILRERWFVNADPMFCGCAACDGAAIDRLRDGHRDRTIGHRHNVLEIDRIFASSLGRNSDQLLEWWAAQIDGTLSAHTALGQHIGIALKLPEDIAYWAELLKDQS